MFNLNARNLCLTSEQSNTHLASHCVIINTNKTKHNHQPYRTVQHSKSSQNAATQNSSLLQDRHINTIGISTLQYVMIKQLLSKIPGGQNVQVFIGTTVLVGLCGVPVFFKPEEKRGHDLFSQERPEAVLDSQEKLLQEYDRKSKLERKK